MKKKKRVVKDSAFRNWFANRFPDLGKEGAKDPPPAKRGDSGVPSSNPKT